MTSQTQRKTQGADVVSARDSLSTRKQVVTREAITDAVADAIRERGIDFSVQDVADRAGITHRTVYRHFDGRDALINAVGDRFERWLAEEGVAEPETLDELPQHVERVFHR